MTYNRLNTINEFVNKYSNQEIEFSQIRIELENRKIKPDEIKIIIRQVDRESQQIVLQKSQNEKGKNIFRGGLILTLMGVFITFATYYSIINTGGYYLLAYGPILAGVFTMLSGKNMMK